MNSPHAESLKTFKLFILFISSFRAAHAQFILEIRTTRFVTSLRTKSTHGTQSEAAKTTLGTIRCLIIVMNKRVSHSGRIDSLRRSRLDENIHG